MPNSFRAALAGYGSTPNSDGTLPHLTKADREHLKRWADDDRTDEVCDSITCATRQHRLTLSDLPDGFFKWFFIQEVLGQRSLAESIRNRWKYRDLFRSRAAQMQKAANILRERTPDDFHLIPVNGEKLAQMLEDAAKQYRDHVAVSWNSPGVVKLTRQSRLTDIFASGLSNILRNLTGKWLDHEVAVLTQIAFDDPDFDNDQVIWIRRGVERGGANQKPAD